MTVILELPVELEKRFQDAAQKNGLSLEEFLLDAGKFAVTHDLGTEDQRLKAIDDAYGMASDSSFSSDDLPLRRQDAELEEAKYEQRFGDGKLA